MSATEPLGTRDLAQSIAIEDRFEASRVPLGFPLR
jgi:hypothetical protein